MANFGRKNIKKKNKKKRVIGVTIGIASIAALIGGYTYYRYCMEGNDHLSASEYFKVSNLETPLGEDEALISLNGEILEARAKLIDGNVYLRTDFVTKYLNDRFYSDKESGGILYTTGRGTMVIKANDKNYTNDKGEVESNEISPLVDSGEARYLSADFVAKYTPMTISFNADPNRLAINASSKGWEEASANKEARVRYYAGIKSDIVDDLSSGEKVRVLGTEGDWTKVFTNEAVCGYVKSSDLSASSMYTADTLDKDTYTHNSVEGKLSLAWVSVTNQTANANVVNLSKNISQLDVVMPTWYSFGDNKGTINDISSAKITEELHAAGKKVWPVVNDFTSKVDIGQILSSKKLRDRMIQRLVSDAEVMKFDGINIDFETVTNESSKDFLQFVRELSLACKSKGIILSIDNYAPRIYNAHYALNEQADYVDYIILMNYDEHYAGSKEIGSVSSIGFVKSNIDLALENVPADRLINALPFYTRDWGTNESGAIEYNQSLGMDNQNKLISEKNAEVTWDEASGQNIAKYSADGLNHTIWMEDAKSLKLKLDASNDKNLKGVAFWRLGYESKDIWSLVSEYKGTNHSESSTSSTMNQEPSIEASTTEAPSVE